MASARTRRRLDMGWYLRNRVIQAEPISTGSTSGIRHYRLKLAETWGKVAKVAALGVIPLAPHRRAGHTDEMPKRYYQVACTIALALVVGGYALAQHNASAELQIAV